MASFEFPTITKAKLASVNVRSEKHGPELVPAVDLKLAIDASNDILNQFHPDLLQSLYFKAAPDDGDQQALDGIEPVTNLPNLKFPKLDGPLKWNTMGAGYELVLDYGLGGDSNLIMSGCEINNFAFSPCEGGTVELTFRVQVTDLDEHIIGKLATLVQHEISIILTAPTPEQVADIVQSMESPFINQAELDEMNDEPVNPFLIDALTPEQALIDSVVT